MTINVKVTDKQGNSFSALELAADQIKIWDHEEGAEVATLATWRDAAAMLEMLQS